MLNVIKQLFKKLSSPNSQTIDFNSFSVFNKANYSMETMKSIDFILSPYKDDDGQILTNLLANIFKKLHYHPEIIDGFDDRGRDLLIFENTNKKKLLYSIQCKSYSPQTNFEEINFQITSSFAGATESDYCTRVFITSSFFTDYSIKNTNNIIFIDRIGLIELLATVYPLETAFILNKYSFYNDVSGYDIKQKIKEFKYQKTSISEIPNHKIMPNFHITCPCCKQGKVQKLFPKNKSYPYFKCRTCNSKFKSKNPFTDFLTKIATDQY